MTPIRPMFLRESKISLWHWAALILFLAFVAWWVLRPGTPPAPISEMRSLLVPPAQEPLREWTSADGKTRCYAVTLGVSCLPVWLLDRPNNWVVMYPHPTPTGKVKK